MTFVNRSEKEFTVCFDCPVNDLLNGERTAEKRIEPLSCAIVSFDGDIPAYETTYQSET